jgi:hypothetical protein
MPLTRMPRAANSRARVRVRFCTPPLETELIPLLVAMT